MVKNFQIIASDPDTGQLPLVMWDGKNPELEILTLRTKAHGEAAITALATGLRDFSLATDTLISEYAHTWQSSGKRVPENSLFRLHEVVGVLAGSIIHRSLLAPTPAEWKGSVPKIVHQPRIVADAKRNGFTWRTDRKLTSHELDSLGLFMWAWKRRGKR